MESSLLVHGGICGAVGARRDPVQRAQLPAFMERLTEKYGELHSDSNLWDASVWSGFMGSDEIWKGSFDDHKYGGESWTLFPRKLQRQYDNQRSTFGYDSHDDTSDAEVWEEDVAVFVARPPGPAWTPEGG